MDISVIVSFYKKLDNLSIILKALNEQSFTSFEVIISEDNNAEATKRFIATQQTNVFFRIKHVFQEDKGFKKTKALNQSLRISEGKIIVFLDGDCIPHTHFLQAFHDNVQEKTACFGRRVFLNKKYSTSILQTQDLNQLSVFRTALHIDEGWRYGIYLPFQFINRLARKGIYGCNWGIYKHHLVEVNGFDEDYELAGFGEDTDIEWRLVTNGIRLQSTRNKTIVYHLFHTSNYSQEEIEKNRLVYTRKLNKGDFICKNGLVQK